MRATLVDAVRRHTDARASAARVRETAIDGLFVVRASARGTIASAVRRPLVCLVVQGAKRVTTATGTRVLNAGASMLVAADEPAATEVDEASRTAPYLAFAMRLDPAIVAELSPRVDGSDASVGESTDEEVADTALRMIRLLERPASIPVLAPSLVREFHYWLLAGPHGPSLRRLSSAGRHDARIARALDILRAEFRSMLTIARLAEAAALSPSAFHARFRRATSLSPMQYQKRLRLVEARRAMLVDGVAASTAARAVGYASASQFSRDYRRLFGAPPSGDPALARAATR